MLRPVLRKLCPLLPSAFITTLSATSHYTTPKPSLPPDSPHREALRGYGIPEEGAAVIIAKFPKLCSLNLDTVVRPKLEFLLGAGFTGPEVAEILAANPFLLRQSLDRVISSSVAFLSSILPSKDAIIRFLKSANMLPTSKHQSNVRILRDHGVPDAMIVKLLRFQPRALLRTEDGFRAAVESVSSLGLAPSSNSFACALGVMSYTSRSTFLRKVELYKELGWPEAAVYEAFKRQPTCLKFSDENIRKKVVFFRDTLGWGPECLSPNPVVLMMSLEGRILPRCRVLSVLMNKGLIPKGIWKRTMFQIPPHRFIEKYIEKYKKEAPEVVEAYRGGVEFQGWDSSKDQEEPKARKARRAPKLKGG